MAMTVSSSGKGVAPQMNVTPLVDVVLVLLIIFMVITPLLTKTFWVHTPKQEKQEVEQPPPTDPNPPLVLHVGAGRTVEVNGTTIDFAELPERLRRMFAARDDHVLFFDAADDAEYGFTVEVMDQARAGGAITIATLTQALGTAPAAAPAAPPAP